MGAMPEGNGSVYPRWRGEHIVSRRDHHARNGLSPLARGTQKMNPMVSLDFGLSPLARGTLVRNAPSKDTYRFIPAGAGNTCTGRERVPGVMVYPRWRGEHFSSSRLEDGRNGLSPLARGTLSACAFQRHSWRFIPAGAGNTLHWIEYPKNAAVYPRWRGEHTKDILLFYNSFLSTQQFTNFIPTISHY